jgi:hypothetical protein
MSNEVEGILAGEFMQQQQQQQSVSQSQTPASMLQPQQSAVSPPLQQPGTGAMGGMIIKT